MNMFFFASIKNEYVSIHQGYRNSGQRGAAVWWTERNGSMVDREKWINMHRHTIALSLVPPLSWGAGMREVQVLQHDGASHGDPACASMARSGSPQTAGRNRLTFLSCRKKCRISCQFLQKSMSQPKLPIKSKRYTRPEQIQTWDGFWTSRSQQQLESIGISNRHELKETIKK